MDIHFIRENVQTSVASPSFVSSSEQVEDMFTKSIGPTLLLSSIVKLVYGISLNQFEGSVGIRIRIKITVIVITGY